jgi:hypothetical protein
MSLTKNWVNPALTVALVQSEQAPVAGQIWLLPPNEVTT